MGKESWEEDSEVRKFYAMSASWAGDGDMTKAVAYSAKISQTVRFRSVLEHFRLDGLRVLDVGCGTGDFPIWLADQTYESLASYKGIDIVPEVIDLARQRRMPDFVQGFECVDVHDFDEVHDVVTAIIAFMIREGTYENSQRIYRNVVNRMWDLCRVGISFDCLSPRCKRLDANVCPVPEPMALDWAFRLSDRVRLDAGYAPHAYTVTVYKEKSMFQKAWDESKGWKSH